MPKQPDILELIDKIDALGTAVKRASAKPISALSRGDIIRLLTIDEYVEEALLYAKNLK